MTRKGRCIRFALASHSEISTKNGRRYMRPDGDDDAIVAVYVTDTTEQPQPRVRGGPSAHLPRL